MTPEACHSSTINYLVGDVRDRVADLEDGSVSLIVTSPPFLALRSYLPADHPMKHAEIGSEPDPAAFIDCLLAQVAQWATKLAPWGSIAVELGDTYAGPQPPYGYTAAHQTTDRHYMLGGSRSVRGGTHVGNAVMGEHNIRGRVGDGWPDAKSQCFIPELFGIALAYGINPLRGGVPARALMDYIDMLVTRGMPAADAIEHARMWLTEAEQSAASPAGRWLVRNKIVWARPNPPVGALGDKFRPATSLIVVATRDPRRWFDLDAVRTAFKPTPAILQRHDAAGSAFHNGPKNEADGRTTQRLPGRLNTHAGAPPLDWHIDGDHDGWDVWRMSTQPYPGSHYATFPAELPRRLIASMCPAEVCRVCGTPRRRVVEHTRTMLGAINPEWKRARSAVTGGGPMGQGVAVTRDTLGWSDCGHDDYTPGVVLDPFAGSGTTLAVAAELGRDAIGIDIDDRNVYLARQRVGEHAHVRQDIRGDADWTWTCEPRLPDQGGQLPGQLSLLGGES